MPNYYLSVLYKHIIQVENKNVGLKVGRHKHTLPPPPASYASEYKRVVSGYMVIYCVSLLKLSTR